MKYFNFLLLISCLLYACKPQTQASLSELIEGDWRCVYVRCDKGCEICCEGVDYIDIQILADSIYMYHYEDQYFGCKKIMPPIVEPEEEKFHDLESILNFSEIELSKFKLSNQSSIDTLIIYDSFFFIRDTFDNKMIDILRQDSINANRLIGNWSLKIMEKGHYGDPDTYYGFPFEVPSNLNFDSLSARTPNRIGRTILIPADGVKQEFRIDYISKYYLQMTTKNWYKGTSTIRYRKA
jgi:hypothetical protein